MVKPLYIYLIQIGHVNYHTANNNAKKDYCNIEDLSFDFDFTHGIDFDPIYLVDQYKLINLVVIALIQKRPIMLELEAESLCF
jgi:hypothetical protein